MRYWYRYVRPIIILFILFLAVHECDTKKRKDNMVDRIALTARLASLHAAQRVARQKRQTLGSR